MSERFDTIIIGGGMVGLTAAIALATAGIKSAVIERVPPPNQLKSTFDGRVSAIALGSQKLLAQIGAWDGMATGAEPINDIRVIDQNSPMFLHYDHTEVGEDPFGWIVENRVIREALFARAEALSEHITLFAPSSVTSFETKGGSASVELEDGSELRASLQLAADGRMSKTRETAGIKADIVPYEQTAIVCTIGHTEPHHGLALERFLPIGPFAVLPMQNNQSSLVWTESHDRAKAMLELPDTEFLAEIESRVGGYLGEVSLVGPRFSYPLTLVHAHDYCAHRLALIGDAAHGIHPIAGQGVNLGFRDVAVLAEVLADAKRLGLDLGFEATLERYARWRRLDSVAMIAATDGLTRLFSNDIFPINTARRAGLAAVGKLPPVKKFFMKHAMGMTGDLPRLMRGKAL